MQPQLLDGLPPKRVQDVLSAARRRSFARGDIVFHQGDPGDSVHLIASGHFGLRVMTPLGESSLLRVFGPDEAFGRVALPGLKAVRASTMVALDAAQTFELSRAQIDGLRAEHLSVSDAMIANLGIQLMWVSERWLELLYVDADRRVRRRILELGEQYAGGEAPGEVAIGLRQEDVASLAGTSRSTVNRVLGEEEALGTVRRTRGAIVLLDAAGLASRAD